MFEPLDSFAPPDGPAHAPALPPARPAVPSAAAPAFEAPPGARVAMRSWDAYSSRVKSRRMQAAWRTGQATVSARTLSLGLVD